MSIFVILFCVVGFVLTIGAYLLHLAGVLAVASNEHPMLPAHTDIIEGEFSV